MKFASKLPDVGTTIFTVMSQLADECGALNLSQGFPDFDAPQELRDALSHYVQSGYNQYPPLAGVAKLREQIACKVQNLYGRVLDPVAEITVTPGATAALYCAITAVIEPGDEVIVFDPAYDSYAPSVQLSGGRTVHVPLVAPQFRIDWQQVKDRVTTKTRMIVLNFPHNPTGAIIQESDLTALAEITRDTSILLLSDEVYEHLVYDGQKHYSLLENEELASRAFVVSSFGKTYHCTGWKTGYCVAPAMLTDEFRKVHQYVTFVGVNPIQWALADFMESHPNYYQELADFYQRKRDLFCDVVKDSRFTLSPSPGTYFQLLDYSVITQESDESLSKKWTREKGIASIPLSVFYQRGSDKHFLRFCFAKADDTLRKAGELLCQI